MMCAAGSPGEDEKLYRTVEAVGMDLCPKLGITVPVGKDSMSMRTAWQVKIRIVGNSAFIINNYWFHQWSMCVKHLPHSCMISMKAN